MYERPTVQRLGSLRSLTEYGMGSTNDLLGILLNVISPNAPDGCSVNGNWLTNCPTKRGS